MAKLYSRIPFEIENELKPKEETVNFLLSYSKALSVKSYNKMVFETILN